MGARTEPSLGGNGLIAEKVRRDSGGFRMLAAMAEQMERGPCYDELHTMGARNEHFEGVASSGPDVLWQYRVTVDIDGTPVQLMGEGLSLEDAACDVLRQLAERSSSN